MLLYAVPCLVYPVHFTSLSSLLLQCVLQIAALKSDVESLSAEIQGRPTVQEVNQLKREIDLLQRKIATVRRQAAGAGGVNGSSAGWEAEEGEAALGLAVVLGGGGASRGSRGTRAAMERDKALARLGLWRVEEYPRDVLVDLLQVRGGCEERGCNGGGGIRGVRGKGPCKYEGEKVAEEREAERRENLM